MGYSQTVASQYNQQPQDPSLSPYQRYQQRSQQSAQTIPYEQQGRNATQLQQARNQGYNGTLQSDIAFSNDNQERLFGQQLGALQSGFSGQSQGQGAYNDLLRDTAAQRIAALQGGKEQSQAANMLDTQLQRGFKTQSNQLQRGASGAGTFGTPGYSKQISGVAQANNEARANALLALQQQGTQELSTLGGIGTGLNNQEMQNRQMEYQQGKDLSSLYGQQLGNFRDDTRYNGEIDRANQQAKDAAKGKLLGSLMTLGGAAAGSIIPGAGTMLGAQLGNALGSGLGGTPQTFQQPQQKISAPMASSDPNDFWRSVMGYR